MSVDDPAFLELEPFGGAISAHVRLLERGKVLVENHVWKKGGLDYGTHTCRSTILLYLRTGSSRIR